MKNPSFPMLLLAISLLVVSSFAWLDSSDPNGFITCLRSNSVPISKFICTPANSCFTPTYVYSIRNPRFLPSDSDRRTPSVIVTPRVDSQVQSVVHCAKKYHIRIRIRSGGHDFEGLSYSSTYNLPFVLLDMINLRNINVNATTKTAIVQAGATLGEVYYWINQASGTLAFPGGVWSTVGVTGLICGGGYGPLRRKYGFAADNVLDVRLVDVHGNILDRNSMGENLFWAVRGGGCSSFGIILSWKLNLVEVPETVTFFTIVRTLEDDGATDIIYPFQTVAPVLPNELDIRVRISTIISNTSTRPDGKAIQLGFTGAYLGRAEQLKAVMDQRFPQLGLASTDLKEVGWIDAVMLSSFFELFSNNYTAKDLLDRAFLHDIPTKAKSDFVRTPIPASGLDGLWEKLLEVGPGETTVIFTPFGGVLDNYNESAIPFPNRAGTLYMVYERVLWAGNTRQKLEWIGSLYDYLTPYVSSNPRRSYWNYDDLDLGINRATGIISNKAARRWGRSYFNKNFEKLIQIKTAVDPLNFFRFEQSIPTFSLFSDM